MRTMDSSSTIKDPSRRFLYVSFGAFCTVSLIILLSAFGPSSKRMEDPVTSLHWTYEPVQTVEEAMEDWSDYLVCSQGLFQSPINIATADVIVPDETVEAEKLEWMSPIQTLDLARLTEAYDDNVFEVRDNLKPLMTVNGTTYHLTEIELHAPSENTIDGKHFDLEIQFRHTAPGPIYMIISAMFVKGQSEPGIIDQMDEIIQTPARTGTRAIEFGSILKSLNSTAMSRYFHFNGSLTSPPCTEGVEWYVLRDPVPALFFDIDEIAQDLSRNNRPIQPLNGRQVEVFGYWPKNETADESAALEDSVEARSRPVQLHAGSGGGERALVLEVEALRNMVAALSQRKAGRREAAPQQLRAELPRARAATPKPAPEAADAASTAEVDEKLTAMEKEILALKTQLRQQAASAVMARAVAPQANIAAATAFAASKRPPASEVHSRSAVHAARRAAVAGAQFPALPALPALPRSASGELPPHATAAASVRQTKLAEVPVARGLERRLVKDEEDEARVLIEMYKKRSA